jgi:hypothetical protein
MLPVLQAGKMENRPRRARVASSPRLARDDSSGLQAMRAALAAGAVYFGAVFAAGVVCGTIRTLLLVPRLGETVAVLLEAPVMLAVSWLVCGWSTRKFHVSSAVSRRLVMGALAFALLMVGEMGISIFVFRRPIEEYLAAYASAPGAIGLGAQIVFALLPLLQRNRR